MPNGTCPSPLTSTSASLLGRIASLGQRGRAAWDADLDSQADRLLPFGRAPGRLAVLQAHGLHRHAAARGSRLVVPQQPLVARARVRADGRKGEPHPYAYPYGPKAAIEHR